MTVDLGKGAPGDVTATSVDRNGVQVLDREACLRLLGQATLGRIGITMRALPVILPVNFRLVGDRIVFRTGAGTKLEAATHNTIVAFEVDEVDRVEHTGWSVVVTGIAREVLDRESLEELAAANIPKWAPSDDERMVEVTLDLVSGRRIGPAPLSP